MIFSELLLPGVLLPTAGAVLIYLLASRLGGRSGNVPAGGVAVAAAFMVAFVALSGWPRWFPVEASQRLFLVAGVAALGSLLSPRLPVLVGWILAGGLLAALLGLLLQTPIVHTWTRREAVAWLLGLFVTAVAVTLGLRANLAHEKSGADPLHGLLRLALVCITAILLGLSQSALLAQLGAATACGIFVVEVVGRLRRRAPWQPADALPVASIFLGLVLIGHYFAELQRLPAALLLLSAVMLGLAAGRSRRFLIPATLAMALAAGLVVREFRNQPEDPYANWARLEPAGAQRSSSGVEVQ